MRIGVLMGNPEITSGGNALKFYASIRIDVRKKDFVYEGSKEEEPIGIISTNRMITTNIDIETPILHGKKIQNKILSGLRVMNTYSC